MYVSVNTKKFMLAVVNFEVKDNANNLLYGVIVQNGDNVNKYPYKLKGLMTALQIKKEYDINFQDLPKQSRKSKQFLNKLLLPRKICRSDVNKVSWSNLKVFHQKDGLNKSETVSVTQKTMKEYVCMALSRLDDGSNELVPIAVINKSRAYYGIEWVLIVSVLHKNCDIGVSFRFDAKNNAFNARCIYLTAGDILSMHTLIGLKRDYCNTHLNKFWCTKFRIKSQESDEGSGVTKAYQYEMSQKLMQDNQRLSSQIGSMHNALQENQRLSSQISALQQETMRMQQQQQQAMQNVQQYAAQPTAAAANGFNRQYANNINVYGQPIVYNNAQSNGVYGYYNGYQQM